MPPDDTEGSEVPTVVGALPGADGQPELRLSVAWVGPDGEAHERPLRAPAGSSLGDVLAALELPELPGLREALTAGRLAAAVFGEVRAPSEPLCQGDRIELLEGLRIDPKLARRRRVEVRRAQAARKPKV